MSLLVPFPASQEEIKNYLGYWQQPIDGSRYNWYSPKEIGDRFEQIEDLIFNPELPEFITAVNGPNKDDVRAALFRRSILKKVKTTVINGVIVTSNPAVDVFLFDRQEKKNKKGNKRIVTTTTAVIVLGTVNMTTKKDGKLVTTTEMISWQAWPEKDIGVVWADSAKLVYLQMEKNAKNHPELLLDSQIKKPGYTAAHWRKTKKGRVWVQAHPQKK